MSSKRWNSEHDDEHHSWNDPWDQDDDGGSHGEFEFEFEDIWDFRIDLQSLNLKSLGKVTDYDVSHKHLSVTLGNKWTFSVEGSDLNFGLRHAHLPTVQSGTIDTFSIDGPGNADVSISGLDLSAKALYKALVHLNAAKVLNLVLGGDETISGSGYGDLLFGAKGDDTLLGNGGCDRLSGGNGDDLIVGGSGSDLLLGGDDADTFAFAPKYGMDLVGDFDVYEDVIDLTGFGFSGNFCDFLSCNVFSEGQDRCYEDEGDVIIDMGNGDMIKLEGVSRYELNEGNVLL
jgi:Ca2+-binding RTX toxin-like protein